MTSIERQSLRQRHGGTKTNADKHSRTEKQEVRKTYIQNQYEGDSQCQIGWRKTNS